MKIIFCHDPVFEGEADSMFIDEVAAASRAGLDYELIDYEALTENNNAPRAVRDVAVRQKVEAAVYRGWSLSAVQYSQLYDALLSRGVQLINTATQYRYTQHLPLSYSLIKAHSPRSLWMETDGKRLSYTAIMQMLIPFAGQAIVLRDYARSEKHYWLEACYISSANDADDVQRVVRRFMERRGDLFEGGLVFREFVEFKQLVEQDMPLINEHRLIYFNAVPLLSFHYWDVEGVQVDSPPLELFSDLVPNVRSRFFTMDVAQRPDGSWMIIDLGDGQIASLPSDIELDVVYRAFAGMA